MLKTTPAVFTVGKEYQIMVEVECESLFSVKIDDKTYYDESNGIMNSREPIHRVSVPMKVLDEVGEYTVIVRPIIERKPYYTQTKAVFEQTFHFNKLPDKDIRIFHIADAHNMITSPVAAANTFGNIDLLILNGDVIDHSGDPSKFDNIYEICAILTGGEKPVIFSRGNHDMRGNFAEKFADYTPSQYKNTYYTFTLGNIWGMLLDCGEDKDDENAEYGHTVACHQFRERQTEFIKKVIKNAENEYAAQNIKTKLVISHNPFTEELCHPFNIEKEIFSEWASLLKEYIKPDLMICGHTHKCGINLVGGEKDNLGQPCPVVVAAEPQKERYIGGGFIINDDNIEVQLTDSLGNIVKKEILKKG